MPRPRHPGATTCGIHTYHKETAMSATGLAAFDSTIQATHVWLNEICEELGWARDPHRAYTALRVVLHALRDRLRPEEAAGFAAQLPLIVRGAFYEGWHPAGKPVKVRSAAAFLAPVAEAFRSDPDVRSSHVARAVFAVVRRHLSAGEVADVVAALPADIRALWP
jgi:uncharacterized protein (DUF2267 family)